LPNTDIGRALQIGETVRLAVQALATPHCTSSHQSVSVGVARTRPNGAGELAVSARLVAGDKKPAQPLASTVQGVDPSRSFVA